MSESTSQSDFILVDSHQVTLIMKSTTSDSTNSKFPVSYMIIFSDHIIRSYSYTFGCLPKKVNL